MRFTDAALDLYKNVRKEAEAKGVIPKPKPAGKPAAKKQRKVAVSFELNGKTHDLEWMGDGSDEEITRIVQSVKDQLGVGEYSDRFLPAAGGAQPSKGIEMGNRRVPKTTGIGPQFPAVRGAEIGAMGAGASRAVSVEEINARELANAPTEDLIREVLRGPNQKTSAKQERYRAVIDELQNRATTAGKNTPLGALMGPTGFLPATDKLKAILNAGHLSGLVSGALLEPFETGASFGKASSGADLDFRDNLNLIGAVPQTGAAIGAIAKKGAEKLAAKVAGKDLITPPVKTGTKPATAAMPATPAQTGIVVRDAPVRGASVLDEALASPTVKPTQQPLSQMPLRVLEDGESPLGKPRELDGREYGIGRDEPGDINLVQAARSGGISWAGIPPRHAARLRKLGVTPADLEYVKPIRASSIDPNNSLHSGIMRLVTQTKLTDGEIRAILSSTRASRKKLIDSGDFVLTTQEPTPGTLYADPGGAGRITEFSAPTVKPAETPSPAKAAETVAPPTTTKPKEPWETWKEWTNSKPPAQVADDADQATINAYMDAIRQDKEIGESSALGVIRDPSSWHNLTQEEFLRAYGQVNPLRRAFDGTDAVRLHGEVVEQALREGKPVPAEVLADYPDLAAKYGNATPPTSVLDEALASPKPRPTEQMPPPVAMDSPIKGSVGEAVPRRNAQLEADAKTHFGTTMNPLEAGYITADGQLLDFSGRHETEPRFARQFDGVRHTDHRDVSQIMDEGGTEAMLKFMGDTGAVRFSSMANGGILVDATAPLTPQQWTQLQNAVRGASDITFEISDPVTGRTLWSKGVDINRSADATRVFNEAKRFWEANPPKTPAPTTSRYGTNYGTPQPGQGNRPGYDYPPMQRTALPENADTKALQVGDPENVGASQVQTATVSPDAPSTPTSARQATGLANVVQDAEANAGMSGDSPRATGTKRGDAQAKGKAAVESGEIDPETLAAEIASGKRTFKDETEVGALMEGKRRLLQQADELGKKIDEAHARGEDATALIAQREAIRARLTTLIENVQVGKGKWSDVGRSLQEGTTINEGVFEDVLAEFRRNKPDGKVSDKETAALADMVKKYNDAQAELKRVQDELAQIKAAEGAQVIARKGTVGRRTVAQIRAERDLVSESISKSIREAIGGPVGFGGGGLENLFEVVPQLARDLRKLIELYIEEFKVGRLDSEFYVGAKQVIRDALSDLPDEVLDDLGVDLKNLSDDEVNRIFGGIYDVKQSRTKSAVETQIAELKKQANLLAKIEAAKGGEVLKAGAGVPPASPTVKDLRATLNELLRSIGEGPEKQAVRTRLQNILDDLNKQSHGKYRNLKNAKQRVGPADIKAIREQIASVRRDMRLEDTLADLEEQLATGNYKTPNKKVETLTKQQVLMRDAVNEKRKIIRRKIAEASRGPFEKAMGVIDGAFSTLREGVATGDISFSGIQGSLALLTDTKAWANGTRASLKSYGSMGYDEIVNLIKSDAEYDKIARTGVDLPAITSESEELFQNSVLQKVPVLGKGVKAAQRSYDGGATMTRYMMAKSHVALAEALNGGPLSDAALKQIGDAVNSMTGRASSKLGKAVRTADFGRGIFAPSYWISLFEAGYRPLTTAIDVGAKTGDWGPAKVYARKTARMYAGGVAVLGTAKLALESQTEYKVEIDPRSSLFGKAYKIKNGKVVSIDLLPPQLSQAIKTVAMQAFGKKDLAGDVDTSAYGRTAWIGQLLEGKAAPGPKMIMSARDSMHVTNEKGDDAKAEDYPFGKNTDPRTGEGLKNLGLGSIPLTAQSAKEMIETDAMSPLEKWLLAPLVVFGRGPNVYPLGKTAKKKLGL